MDPKILILGHGWRMMRDNYEPRCAPMTLDEWNDLVVNTDPSNLTFFDMDESVLPDIVENMGNNWSVHDRLMQQSYDYIIDATSRIATMYRKSAFYWDGVKQSLKPDGVYIGWNDKRCIRVARKDIDDYISKTYHMLTVPHKPFDVFRYQ